VSKISSNAVHPRGVYAPTITAFDRNGDVCVEGTRQFVRFLLNQGVDGLTPLGSAGEPISLTTSERKTLLEAIVAEAGSRVPIYAGIVDYSTRAVIELSQHAKSVGCNGLMLMAPYMLRPPKRDVFDHFRRVREAVGLPIMLYNVPALNGVDITPEEVRRLVDEDVIHSVKWSHVEVSRVHDTRLLCGPTFPIFAGIDLIAFEAMAVGADGWIGGLPMIVPQLAVQLQRLLTSAKDLDAARELWYRLVPIIRMEYGALSSTDNDPHWLAVCRESAALRGIPVGSPRRPLSSVSTVDSEQLKGILTNLGEIGVPGVDPLEARHPAPLELRL
jgi:4-hydroxy-tetrahydrodipicolinate synthase